MHKACTVSGVAYKKEQHVNSRKDKALWPGIVSLNHKVPTTAVFWITSIKHFKPCCKTTELANASFGGKLATLSCSSLQSWQLNKLASWMTRLFPQIWKTWQAACAHSQPNQKSQSVR